jgi:hypothetical protein
MHYPNAIYEKIIFHLTSIFRVLIYFSTRSDINCIINGLHKYSRLYRGNLAQEKRYDFTTFNG